MALRDSSTSFTHPHVIPNLNESLSSVKHKITIFFVG